MNKRHKKDIIITSVVFLGGYTLCFIFYKYTMYAIPLFICFPLSLYHFFKKRIFIYGGLLRTIPRIFIAVFFFCLGMYYVLRISNILP